MLLVVPVNHRTTESSTVPRGQRTAAVVKTSAFIMLLTPQGPPPSRDGPRRLAMPEGRLRGEEAYAEEGD